MTDVVQPENKPEGFLKGVLDKFVDRLPTMDEDKSRLLFISVMTIATLGTLSALQVYELGWIAFFTFLSGIFAGVGIPLLRAYLAAKEDKKIPVNPTNPPAAVEAPKAP